MDSDQPTCRHGVSLCYRCGIGASVTDGKVARMRTIDEQLLLELGIERPSKPSNARESKSPFHKKRRLIPCLHRGDYVGVLDCACDGTREIHRCTKLARPNRPEEQAFCMAVLTSKPYYHIIDRTTKKILFLVEQGEIHLCKPVHQIEMHRAQREVGCQFYEPEESPSPNPASS